MLRSGTGFKRVIIRCGKTDLRKGISGLVAIIRLEYDLDPLQEETLFLFCGTKRNCIKGICFDRDGYCMITKRLTEGVYQWPRYSDEARTLTMEEFKRLMEGFTVQSSIHVYERKMK
ncbi:MAG: IS66 family insertion sequence element accessory protein TnpB [Oscillospiraceae bacterium]|nr:IS66 family insertion sequence element accessory protein TnpB [Oscillospiraceae bacterium]